MNREVEIGQLLEQFKKIFEQNPYLTVTQSIFYSKFCDYDIRSGHNDPANELDKEFDKWIEDFKSVKNIDVYFDERQTRFLQFRNDKGIDFDTLGKCYKLYLSFPRQIMPQAVEEIFKFTAKHNMAQISKVADVVRSDSIVLRILEKKDVLKIMQFVNSNEFLRRNALKTNPFLPREGIVGFAYDDNLSYNSMVCIILKNYFQAKIDSNRLSEVNLEDFKKYVKYVCERMNTKDGINKIMADPDIYRFTAARSHRCTREQMILNVKQVFELIAKGLNNNFTLGEYMYVIEQYKDKEQISRDIDGIKDVFKTNAPAFNAKKLLDEYILYAAKKYGIEGVSSYLNTYLSGYENGITRDNGYRAMFIQHLPIDKLRLILGNNVEAYIRTVCDQNFRRIYTVACTTTLKKYGMEHLKLALRMLMEGDYRGITDDFHARTDLLNYLPYDYLQQLVAADLALIEQNENHRSV